MLLLGKGAQVEAQFGPFASNVPYAQKSIWTHTMELLDDMCHMESRFYLFGDSVSFDAT